MAVKQILFLHLFLFFLVCQFYFQVVVVKKRHLSFIDNKLQIYELICNDYPNFLILRDHNLYEY